MPRVSEPQRQLDSVLDALNSGARTAGEIALRTRPHVNVVCTYLNALVTGGAAEYIGKLQHAGRGPKPLPEGAGSEFRD
ncbi:MAG TPA: hypothetical protein VHY84_27235 [Bryobacteraceae bacterium]|jgi:hypothetical protein|nr:hypothetical protein [Bryobacteraceae bacterium]